MARTGLEICDDDVVFLRNSFLDQDVVGKLSLDSNLNGFGKETRERAVLIVQVEDQRPVPAIAEIGNQETCRSRLARATFRAGCENESARHRYSPCSSLSSSTHSAICSGVSRSRLYSELGVK